MPTNTIICILFILNHLRVKEGYTTSLSLKIAYTITFSAALSVNSNGCPLSLTFNLNNTVYIYYKVDLIATNSIYLVMLSFCFHTLIVQSSGLIGAFYSAIPCTLAISAHHILSCLPYHPHQPPPLPSPPLSFISYVHINIHLSRVHIWEEVCNIRLSE